LKPLNKTRRAAHIVPPFMRFGAVPRTTPMTDLTDEDFDDMHHAIGRRSIEGAYRNYYCTPTGSHTAKRFEATG
jgi:hypothetical protein